MIKKLTRQELIALIEIIMKPKGTGFSSQEIDQKLLLFCINCPDPGAAMDLVVEPGGPTTPEALVDRALAYPPRDVSALPESELPLTHPLRRMKLNS